MSELTTKQSNALVTTIDRINYKYGLEHIETSDDGITLVSRQISNTNNNNLVQITVELGTSGLSIVTVDKISLTSIEKMVYYTTDIEKIMFFDKYITDNRYHTIMDWKHWTNYEDEKNEDDFIELSSEDENKKEV